MLSPFRRSLPPFNLAEADKDKNSKLNGLPCAVASSFDQVEEGTNTSMVEEYCGPPPSPLVPQRPRPVATTATTRRRVMVFSEEQRNGPTPTRPSTLSSTSSFVGRGHAWTPMPLTAGRQAEQLQQYSSFLSQTATVLPAYSVPHTNFAIVNPFQPSPLWGSSSHFGGGITEGWCENHDNVLHDTSSGRHAEPLKSMEAMIMPTSTGGSTVNVADAPEKENLEIVAAVAENASYLCSTQVRPVIPSTTSNSSTSQADAAANTDTDVQDRQPQQHCDTPRPGTSLKSSSRTLRVRRFPTLLQGNSLRNPTSYGGSVRPGIIFNDSEGKTAEPIGSIPAESVRPVYTPSPKSVRSKRNTTVTTTETKGAKKPAPLKTRNRACTKADPLPTGSGAKKVIDQRKEAHARKPSSEKGNERKEKNRIAAQICRKKKKDMVAMLVMENDRLNAFNQALISHLYSVTPKDDQTVARLHAQHAARRLTI